MAVESAVSPSSPPELDKGYDPAKVEPRWAAFWEQRGFFHAQDVSEKWPFSIILPPPNVTGSLHIGHALTATLEDILIRYKRMSGFNALWMPGIDHAGIATQMVVERELKKEGKSRHDLGREKFLERVWQWKEQSGSRISQQHRALGASLDWERERFTMDAQSSRAVREAFVRLHEEGLIYRAERLINWCTSCRTALSDLEVEHHEGVKTELYKFAYPLAEPLPNLTEIVVATTRPETMLGDTAVAVHPDDPRYQDAIGKLVRHPIIGRTFPIVADPVLVDMKFGTGAVKVTPGHSFEDFESGKRNKLELINILNLDGTLNSNAGPFEGMDRIKARPAIRAKLAELGLERGTEPHVYAVGHCQRCDSIVEPLLSKQWFVKMEPLARPAISAVEQGRIKFIPESWTAEFFRWLRNIHDWCISRQLWWGHQIPAWTCPDGHVTVARETPTQCGTCRQEGLIQDPDVLDTWFSSGLWPMSTLGWPEKTPAFATFYPTSVMETGFDILFFWVARMAMLGLHFTGEVPFKTVFLHAMVRDEKGEKMSKTRGNVIDPLEITSKHGADALRMALASMAGQGRDIKLSVDRIAGYRAFANKIWNAARFVLMNAEGYEAEQPQPPNTVYDRWILSRFQRCAEETSRALDELRFNDASLGVYKFVWGELCDWAIELSKPALYGEKTAAARAGAQSALLRTLEGSLRLLHPFMPFVTEEIWQRLPRGSNAARHPQSIMVAEFPQSDPHLIDEHAEKEMDLVARAIDGARSVRGEVNLPPNQRIPIVLVPRDEKARSTLEAHRSAFAHLAAAEPVTVTAPGAARPKMAAVHHEPEVEVHLPLAGLIDFAEEAKRVEKELARIDAELLGIDKRLSNEGFVARAPREVVEKDRARAQELRGKREKMSRHLARVTSPEASMEERKDEKAGEAGQSHATGEGDKSAQPGQGAGGHAHPYTQESAGAEKHEGAPREKGGEGGADQGRGEPYPSHGQDRGKGEMGTHGGPEHHQAQHGAPSAAPVHANGHTDAGEGAKAEAPPAAPKAKPAPKPKASAPAPAPVKAKPKATIDPLPKKPSAKPAKAKAKPAAKAKAKAKPAAKAKAKAKPAAAKKAKGKPAKAKAKARPAAKKGKAKPAAKKGKAKAKAGKGKGKR